MNLLINLLTLLQNDKFTNFTSKFLNKFYLDLHKFCLDSDKFF